MFGIWQILTRCFSDCLGMAKYFNFTFYWACDYFSILLWWAAAHFVLVELLHYCSQIDIEPLAIWLFVQQPVQANHKEDTTAPHYWFCVRGLNRCNFHRKGTAMWKVFPCDVMDQTSHTSIYFYSEISGTLISISISGRKEDGLWLLQLQAPDAQTLRDGAGSLFGHCTAPFSGRMASLGLPRKLPEIRGHRDQFDDCSGNLGGLPPPQMSL